MFDHALGPGNRSSRTGFEVTRRKARSLDQHHLDMGLNSRAQLMHVQLGSANVSRIGVATEAGGRPGAFAMPRLVSYNSCGEANRNNSARDG